MSVSVTLRQEKTILEDIGYRVVSRITLADPDGMYPLFVVSEGVSALDENWERVATLDDLAEYVENPLASFTDYEGLPGGIQDGDKLVFPDATSEVPEWFDSYFINATFTINSSVDAYTLTIIETNPFPTATSSLSYQIWDSTLTTLRGSGTTGFCYRLDTSKTVFLRRHWTSILADVQRAENRRIAIETGVESIVNAAKVTGVSFQGVTTEIYE